MNMDVFQLLELLLESNKQAGAWLTWIAGTFRVAFPIFLLVLITTFLFRRWLRPWSRHLLWSLVLLRLILPVSVASGISAQNLWSLIPLIRSLFTGPPDVQIFGGSDTAFFDFMIWNTRHSAFQQTGFEKMADGLPPELFRSLQALLVMGSILVVGIMMSRFFTLYTWMRYGRERTDPMNAKEISDAQCAFGIGGQLRLRTVHQLTHTATFDWFRPTILIPENFSLLPETDQAILLNHELARIRRGDSSTSLLLAVVRIFHWWNPLFWWAGYQWKLERELACDALLRTRLSAEDTDRLAQHLAQLRNSQAKGNLFAIESPGFITNRGSDLLLERRLANLARPALLESRFQYWFSWCVITILTISGLTDPYASRQDIPILLPAGTIWNESASSERIREPTELREYSLSEKVSDLVTQFPQLTEDQIVSYLEQRINSMFGSDFSTHFPIDSEANDSRRSSPRCRVTGHNLIVEATPTQHELINRRIAAPESDELKQVLIEVRRISTRLELSHLLPKKGGQVIDSGIIPYRNSYPFPDVPEQFLQAGAGVTVQKPISIFVQRLIPFDVAFIADESQKHQRISATFGPTTIRALNGQVASVSTSTQRPFATSYSTLPGGVEPRIINLAEGTEIHVFAYADLHRVTLRLKYRISAIQEIKDQSLFIGSKKRKTQIPNVHEMSLESSAVIKSGDTLLITPLIRSEQGELSLLLITPRILEPSN